MHTLLLGAVLIFALLQCLSHPASASLACMIQWQAYTPTSCDYNRYRQQQHTDSDYLKPVVITCSDYL
jgi:hypothetical protein